jgi:hypothetical protein
MSTSFGYQYQHETSIPVSLSHSFVHEVSPEN